MGDRKPVEFARVGAEREDALALTDRDDAATLHVVRCWLSAPGELDHVDLGVLGRVLARLHDIARPIVEGRPAGSIEKHQQPLAATRHGLACGSCGWCVDGSCTVDPPMTWKGENSYRFIRPEVGEDTPACSRWEKREDH